MERLPFYSDCVAWPDDKLAALRHLVDEGENIARATFMKHVRTEEIPPDWYPHNRFSWGYSFARLRGWPIYWYVHSAIEFVFAEPRMIDALALAIQRGETHAQ